MTEHFFSGGTHYEKPLRMALQIIEEQFDTEAKGRPDIVFITDDAYTTIEPSFLAEWNRVKAKASIMCYGISLGCDMSGALQAVADNVRSVTALVADPGNLGDIFQTI